MKRWKLSPPRAGGLIATDRIAGPGAWGRTRIAGGMALLYLMPVAPGQAQSVAPAPPSSSTPPFTSSAAREVPAQVHYARLQVLQSPDILLDEQPARLSPGARIRNPMNLIALPASLTGPTWPVLFRREANGLVHEVWILTEHEAASLQRASTPSAWTEVLSLLWATRR